MADNLTLDRQAMKNRATAHLRIYVGGLTEKASVEELYDHFISFGKINGIVVNRGFGFVQFDEEKCAQDAIAKADGSVFQGKTLSVRTAQTNPDKRRDNEGGTTQQEAPSTDIPIVVEDGGDEPYDSYGNYVGDKSYRDDEYEENTNFGQARGRGAPRGRGRGAPRGRGMGYRERSPIPNRAANFDRYSQHDYGRAVPVTERNDCEIIVVSKGLTEYAEYIEGRLKHLGIVVDLLFPMEDVPIGKVLGNIASRGCLYAILVMPQNQEHRSLTLTILHGLPQEHRNMPLEDGLQLISRNFQEVQRGGPTGREAVYALLGQLADGRALTGMQYDKVIEYLQERKEQQIKIELGEPLAPASNNKAQDDLQKRILSILNDKEIVNQSEPVPAPVPTPAPPTQAPPTKLLNDPTVKKTLLSILQKFT